MIDAVSWHLWDWGDPWPPYWFDWDDNLGTYCLPCAEIEYGFERPSGDFGIDGGWSGERDGCQHCERCGRLLEYSLTDYGTRWEIEHYFENPPDVLTPDEAYHIAKALDNAAWMPDIQGPAFVVALRAMAAIPLLPPQSH